MKKSIFILEDNDDIREVIIHILSEENYEVKGFATVADFRSAILFAQPDLIILDVMLTDGNGIDVCDELKDNRRTQHIPVVMMSAHQALKDVIQKCETEAFINKPFDIDDFVKQINDQLY